MHFNTIIDHMLSIIIYTENGPILTRRDHARRCINYNYNKISLTPTLKAANHLLYSNKKLRLVDNMERLQVLYRQISPLVTLETSPCTASIKINRPKALNALNYEILSCITLLTSEHREKTLIFSSTLPKSFCAGGDVNATIENDLMVPEFYRTELSTFYHISRVANTIAIMQGFSIGAGNGLAMACKYRVCTNSTRFSMPENTIGLVPDTGASYFLTHLPNRALGMYLMVTGKTLSGNECYWARIATHYVTDDKVQELHQEILRTGNIAAALERLATQPNADEAQILRDLPEIEQVFSGVDCVESILQRLAVRKTKFAEDTLRGIAGLCPLSVKVAVKSFLLGIGKSYKECLEQDYGIEVQMCFRRSYNYTTAITQKFIKKEKGNVPWYPAEISQVTQEMVDAIISNPEGPKLSLPN